MPAPRSIIIHGHFYQPPREDPWLEEIEAERSAAPFHDWNSRIEQECYRAVAAARITGPGGGIARIVNCYAWLSFNVGPTLLEWMEHAAPDTYAALLTADRESAARLGHGNAIAMPYHHAILPLSSRREKVTEVRWGIADFRRRFGREPAGMWLPETAVDEETLEVLAEAGMRFTVLAPSQVAAPPPLGLPGLVRLAGGRSMAVFVYDGGISHDVAFGPMVRDGLGWASRMLADPSDAEPPALVTLATDGETYGHHHPFGEMALARMLEAVHEAGARVENFAAFLARQPARHEVTLISPSAWSCAHGVERWRSDCSCRIAHDRPSQQAWRTPLREAVAGLTAGIHARYDREAPGLFRDAGEALAGYGAVMGAGPESIRNYVAAASRPGTVGEDLVRATELLEMERGALRTLTSCAWFFDDIGGIEAVQVLRYAAWVVSLAGDDGPALESEFARRLAPAQSNDPHLGNGRDIYLARAKPRLTPAARVAAGLAAAKAWAPGAVATGVWSLEGAPPVVRLVSARTGRSMEWEVALEREALEVRVRISGPGAEEAAILTLADFPERQRMALANVLRREALARLLDPAEQADLAGGTPLVAVIRCALFRQVRALATDHGAEARLRVGELVTVLGELGQTVPFEAQTQFYRAWQAGPQDDAGMMALARRLGFAPPLPLYGGGAGRAI